MELAGKTVVVTGGGSGIGRALAMRFCHEGARVVVADRDLGTAAQTALACNPHPAMAVACDVRNPDEINALVDETEAAFGLVDLFCANAGVSGGHGLATPDAGWDDAWQINVRAHVQAARRLLPGWLERGEGYFLSTASAAGLLTAIGSGPYTVSKHAAVGFAEWLAIAYGDRGIKVSCLCPMGVDTPLLHRELDLPAPERLGGQAILAASPLLKPDDVAEAVVEGLRAEYFLILPHRDVAEREQGKVADRDAWLARMREFQSHTLSTLEIPV